ncbi:MAG: tRNA uridine-5-carboxymethylaminomethyl(34) synthesis GTPase MnmE [Candidatus Firestonebacteria bacterium]
MKEEETIVAISTPLGESGIGIVRLSGKNSLDIVSKVFKPKSGKNLSTVPTFSVHFGYIVHPVNNLTIDEVIVSVMKAPKTYTREDVVEINCHGGIIPLKKVLELCISAGAKLAEPGEFTKRAFLNGRIDLTQAEAVMDIIKAKTEESLKAAINQLKGRLSEKINNINNELKNICVLIEANIEFPEEEIEVTNMEGVKNSLKKISESIDKLLKTFDEGKILREGVKTVITGKPNVGKSSLLNELLEEERAIVTHIPGTTRDVIEESINIEGIPFVLVDTAGIRKSDDFVEKKGIEKAFSSLEKADLVLFILDGSQDLSSEDYSLADEIKNKKIIIIINKIDLPLKVNEEDIKKIFSKEKILKISLLKKIGIEDLKRSMANIVLEKGRREEGEVLITNVRHKILLQEAKESIKSAIDSIDNKMSEEFIIVDIRSALDSTGEIVGKTSTEDILNTIFTQFCIGK